MTFYICLLLMLTTLLNSCLKAEITATSNGSTVQKSPIPANKVTAPIISTVTGGSAVNNVSSTSSSPLTLGPNVISSIALGPKVLAGAYDATTIKLTWTAPTGAQSYEIYFANNANVTLTSNLITTSLTNYTHLGLTTGRTYFYRVRAVTSSGYSQLSALVFADAGVAATLTVTGGNNQSTLSWQLVAGADTYNIYRDIVKNVTTASLKLSNTVSPYVDNTITNGTTYFYRIEAVTLGVPGPLSNTVNVTPGSVPIAVAGVVVAPIYLGASITFNSVPNAKKYNLYWSQFSPVSKSDHKVTEITSPYIQTGLPLGSQIYYTVDAENDNGESVLSAEVSLTIVDTPSMVQKVTLNSPTSTSVVLTWPASTNSATYKIYYQTSPGVTSSSPSISSINATTYNQVALIADTVYYYRVVGVSASGTESQLSPEVKAIVGGVAATGFSICYNNYVRSTSNDTVKSYAGGIFTRATSCTGAGFAINPTTGLQNYSDSALASTYIDKIANWSAVVSDLNGGWFVGGDFIKVGGDPTRPYLFHVLPTGFLDTSFNPAPDGGIYSLAFSNGTLYVGGSFANIGGQARNNLASVDMGGNASSWNPSPDNFVMSMATDGAKIYIGGTFANVGGAARAGIAAIDLSGNATAWNPGVNNLVRTLILANSLVYIGGDFTTAGGSARNYIAALDPLVNTLNATAWNPNASAQVYGLTYDSGLIYAAGKFNTIGTNVAARSYVAAIDSLGAATAFNVVLDFWAFSVVVQNSTVYISGQFAIVAGQPRLSMASVNLSGAVSAWDPSAGNTVLTMAGDGNTIYALGNFQGFGGLVRNHLAAMDSNGNLLSWNPNADGIVWSVIANGTSSVYVGGEFANVGGTGRSRVAEIDTTGVLTAWNPGADDKVYTMARAGTTMYLGGDFLNAGGSARTRLAEVSLATGLATAWSPSANGSVWSLFVSGTNVYVGGAFTTINATARNRIAKIANPMVLQGFNPNADNTVFSVYQSHAGVTYATGDFLNIGGSARTRIASLNSTTGTAIGGFNPTADSQTLGFMGLGATFMTWGWFYNVGGSVRPRLAEINAAGVATAFAITFDPSTIFSTTSMGSNLIFGTTYSVSIVDSTGASLSKCFYADSFEDYGGGLPGWAISGTGVQSASNFSHGEFSANLQAASGAESYMSRVVPSTGCQHLKMQAKIAAGNPIDSVGYVSINGVDVWTQTVVGTYPLDLSLASYSSDVTVRLGVRNGTGAQNIFFDDLKLAP